MFADIKWSECEDCKQAVVLADGQSICDQCADKRKAARWDELCKIHDNDNSPLKERAQKMFLAFVRLRYHQVEE